MSENIHTTGECKLTRLDGLLFRLGLVHGEDKLAGFGITNPATAETARIGNKGLYRRDVLEAFYAATQLGPDETPVVSQPQTEQLAGQTREL